jgi:hypothetical protein
LALGLALEFRICLARELECRASVARGPESGSDRRRDGCAGRVGINPSGSTVGVIR